jgi:hypothetical protein
MAYTAPPNYTQLAQQTTDSANAAANKTTLANRPNVNTAQGSSNWTQGPNGEWTNTQTLNPADQQRLDATRTLQQGQIGTAQGLLGQAQNTMANPLDTSGMQAYNPNALDPGFGAVQQVKDDYLNLMQPQMDQERQTMESTLKQRGIPMNSPAWTAAMNQLSDSTARRGWEATGKATDAYNDIFNRGLAGNTQANQTRNQQLNEATTLRDLPMNEMLKMQQAGGTVDPTLKLPSFMGATAEQGVDFSGAANTQFEAQKAIDAANAKKKSGLGGAIGGLLGGVAGSFVGMPTLGASLGSSLGGQIGGR